MLGLLIRMVFAALCAALVISTWWQIDSTTVLPSWHDASYRFHPYLRETRLATTFAVLILCLLMVRRDPLFTRIGLLSVLASLAILLIPPREIHQTVTKIEGKVEQGR